jgi:hypothetical protein
MKFVRSLSQSQVTYKFENKLTVNQSYKYKNFETFDQYRVNRKEK